MTLTIHLHWPQLLLILLILIDLCSEITLHGQSKTGKYNFWTSLCGAVVLVSLLFWGGFFQ